MATIPDLEYLKKVFKGQKKHKAYEKTCDLYNDLKLHADGEKPDELLSDRRPNESEEVQKYRQKIFVEITKGVITKVLTCLSKIRKAEDWDIKYDPKADTNRINENERPFEYFEKKFPHFTSVTNWTFNVALKNYVIDANAVCIVMPLEVNISEGEYLRPFPFIFNSPQVWDYAQDDYAIIYSTDKSKYTEGNQEYDDGDIFFVVTTEKIQRWEQVKRDRTMELRLDYSHGLGMFPGFRLGGQFSKSMDGTFIWESRCSGMVPYLKEAVREYTDLQSEVVQHIHSEKYEFSTIDCSTCKGIGKVKRGESTIKCKDCNGTGTARNSPYLSRVIRPAKPGEQPIPTPPAGYIQKQVEIVKIQDERVENHKYRALAAINLEFLMQAPLNQSGLAKEVDRDEASIFINSNGEDVVSIMDKVYFIGGEYRYRVVMPDKKARIALLPKIPVPDRFDLMTVGLMIDDVKRAKDAGLNPVLISAMEVEVSGKKFAADPDIRTELQLVFKLDPMPGITVDEKMSLLQNKGVTQENFVISGNIVSFVRRAIIENAGFADLKYEKQMAILVKYAAEIIKATSAADQVRMKMEQEQQQQSQNLPV